MANTNQEKPEAAGTKRKLTAKKTEPNSEHELDRSNRDMSSAQTMRKMARQTVKQNSAAFAESLYKKASEGDVNSAKLLLSLMEAQPEKASAKKKRRGRTEAMELATEPDWQEPGIESFVETMGERRDRKADGEP